MWKYFVALLVYTFLQNANATLCVSDSCPTDQQCLGRQSTVSIVDSTFQTQTMTGSDESCEDPTLSTLLNLDNACQRFDTDICVPIIDCETGLSTTCYPFVSLEIEFSSSSTENTAHCEDNEILKAAVDNVLECIVSDDLARAIICDLSLPDGCPDWMNQTVIDYPECACTAGFDALGVAGYPYISSLSNWVQQNINQVMTIDCGDVTLMDINCDGLITNCEVNDDLELDCNEIDLIPDDVPGWLEATFEICAGDLPNDLTRTTLWDDLKAGVELELTANDVLIELDAYVRQYEAKGKGKSKPSKGASSSSGDDDDVVTHVECDRDQWLIFAQIRFTYDSFDDLIELVLIYDDTVEFGVGVGVYIATQYDITFADFFFELILYNENGEEYSVVAVGDFSGVSSDSFRAIVVVLVVAMIAWNQI